MSCLGWLNAVVLNTILWIIILYVAIVLAEALVR